MEKLEKEMKEKLCYITYDVFSDPYCQNEYAPIKSYKDSKGRNRQSTIIFSELQKYGVCHTTNLNDYT